MKPLLFILMLIASVSALRAQQPQLSAGNLELINVKVEPSKYKGKDAIHVLSTAEGEQLAIIKNSNFKNGIIEIEVSGQPLPNASPGARIYRAGFSRSTNRLPPLRMFLHPANERTG